MKHYIKPLIICLLLIPQLNLFGKDQNYVSDSLKAVILLNKGIDLIRNGMAEESLEPYLQSLKIRTNIYNKEDYKQFAWLYRLIAISYKDMGLYEQALTYAQKAEQAYIKGFGENSLGLAFTYSILGNIYRSRLNYNEALKYYNQMISVYKNQPVVDQERITFAYYSIAEIYYKMDKYNDVIQVANENFNKANTLDKLYYSDLLGATYQILKQYDEAIQYFQKAVYFSEHILPKDSTSIAYEYLKLANVLSTIGKTTRAENAIKKAKPLIFFHENEKGINAASYYRSLAILAINKHIESKDMDEFKFQKNKNLLEAIDSYKKALQAYNFPADIDSTERLTSISNSDDIECLSLLKEIGNTYIEIARINEGKNENQYIDNLDLALNYYKIAGAFVQQIRKEISDDESKMVLAGLEQSTFIDVVKTSYLAYKVDSNFKHIKLAFTNAERLKSGSIFDKLEATLAKDNSLIPDSLLQQEKLLNSTITSHNELRFNELTSANPDSTVIAHTDSVLFQLNQKRLELNTYLEHNYSNYYDLKYSGSLYNVEEIQQKLKNNEVLIEYVLNETDTLPELYSILISNDSAKFIKQNIDNQFINNIESVFHFMSSPRYMFTTNEDAKVFCSKSYELYQKLIGPFEDEIRDKKIIVVPDGKLNYIAFDALIDKMPDTTKNIRFNNLDYLIKKNCINYSYSANLLFKFDDLSRKANKTILAFAPEYQTDTFKFENQKLVLMPLPGVKKEVDNISHEVKTKIFEGADATEINFRENVENYDILHLAMHAYINDSLPAFSRLAFTQHTGNQPNDDGWLNTADIYNLNLNARLTVLSACNTGTGKLQKGEGVMSLARGFLYAGCPSIIMTLWEAEDNSGTIIMSSFYKYLKKGKPKDEALRLAKLDYLDNANPRLAHPHYWLSYVNIGNNTPLFRSYDFYFFSLLILAFIGITTEQILRIRKARKKRT